MGGAESGSLEQAIEPDTWAVQLAAGNLRAIQARFAAAGAAGPHVVWRPKVADLAPAPLCFLHSHWMALKGARPLPLLSQIDPLEMQPALGYITLVDVIENGRDYHYRLFGTAIAIASGYEMTGRRLSEHRASDYVVEFYRAVYRAVLRRPEPVLTVHSPPVAVSTTIWHRLVLPLAGASGQVERFLTGVVPLGRDGRQI